VDFSDKVGTFAVTSLDKVVHVLLQSFRPIVNLMMFREHEIDGLLINSRVSTNFEMGLSPVMSWFDGLPLGKQE